MKIVAHIAAIAFVMVAILAPYPVFAEKFDTASIAVLNSSRVLRESNPAKSIEKQIAAFREEYRKKTAAEERDLREVQTRLQQKQAVMSKEAFAKEALKFRKQQEQLKQAVRERSARLKASLQKALYKLNKELLTIVSKLSVQAGANLVMDRKELVFYATAMDITDQAIEQLNKTLNDVKVQDPATIK